MHKKKIINTLWLCAFTLAFGYVYIKNKETTPVVSEIQQLENHHYNEIVYQDEDQLLVPVHIEMNEESDLNVKALSLFQQMKSTPTIVETLSPVVDDTIELYEVSLSNETLYLDFNEALLYLDKEDSLKFIEAMTWTMCHAFDVDQIHFTCNGQEVTNLPDSFISLSKDYHRNLGLNNFETVNATLHKTTPLTVYGNKSIDGQSFYVPITERINVQDLSIQEKVALLLSKTSISSLVKENSALKSLEILEGTKLENGKLTVNLNDEALLDEMSLNPQVMDLLILSLRQIDGVESIQFEVNGEHIGEEEVSQNIVYNVIKM